MKCMKRDQDIYGLKGVLDNVEMVLLKGDPIVEDW
jgi:hypothetical protein